MVINKFRGDYFFLSNMMPCKPFVVDGVEYHSAENYYQAMKFASPLEHIRIAAMTPKESKVYARINKGRQRKLNMCRTTLKRNMRQALEYKFKDPVLKRLLLSTGDATLIEGNHWNDVYWGVCEKTGKGENNLGLMLMALRSKLRFNTMFGE